VQRIETTEKAIRRLIDKQSGPVGLSVCYEAGPGGFALWRLLTRLGWRAMWSPCRTGRVRPEAGPWLGISGLAIITRLG
jgi:hypothetical protein